MFKYRENKPYAYIGDENYIFISYSRKDKEIVYNDLLEMNKLKVRFWYDDDIEAGVKWTEKVKKIISSPHCVGVVFYLSKNVLSSEAIENEIKMVIGINDAQRKKYFSLLIDYDQTDYSLSNIIKNELMKDNSLEFSSRCSLINSIFGGEINYLFRSPKVDSLSHFYKMISRIVNFGAVPIEALKKISADYSDFSFYDIDKDIGIKKYTGKENIVRIPEKVYGKAIIEIGEYAFAKNQTIEEVFIPNTLKDIKSNAFFKCEHLKKVNFDIEKSQLELIGPHSFLYCESLKSIDLPENVKELACSCFVEGEFGSWGVDRINFNGKKAPIFDPESVYCSLLFVPIEVKNDYEKASKCSSNVYSKLNPPANVSFKNNIITWKNDPYASGYEILIDGIPLKIVKGCHIQYTPQEGLHTVSLMALGDYEKNVLSSNYSKDIYCGTTKHTFFNYHKNILFSYSGALSTVIIPHDITIIDETNQPLTFSNVERIYFHKDVEEIPYSTIAHIKEVYIDKDNPYYKIEDGNIIETKTNKALRPSILGKTYEYNGNLYSTETQSLIEKK